MAFSRAKLAVAAIRFVSVLITLLVPWPGLALNLTRAYVWLANTYLVCLRAAFSVQMFTGQDIPGNQGAPPWTVEVLFRAPASGAVLEAASLEGWHAFHLPATVFLALCLAWMPRRAWHVLPMLGLGVCLLVALPLLGLLEHAARLGLVPVGRPLLLMIVTANRALWAPTGMAFIVPAAIWLSLLSIANRIANRGALATRNQAAPQRATRAPAGRGSKARPTSADRRLDN